MKLELSIMAGAQTKEFLGDLSVLIDRMEKAALKLGGKPTSVEPTEVDDAPSGRKPKSETVDVDDTNASVTDDDFGAKPPKTAKPVEKELTVKDCVTALKAHATRKKRESAVAILESFGVDSVHDLDPKCFGKLIAKLNA